MLVFLSWSGDRSKAVAHALQKWLAEVIHFVEPWMSTDIDKGARWSDELSSRLEQSRIGIMCLTAQSLRSPWIFFEAGALAKTKDALVCNLLVDIPASKVILPLGQFQHTTTSRDDMFRLLQSINAALPSSGEKCLTPGVLERVFTNNWPRLQADLEKIANTSYPDEAVTRPAPPPLDLMSETVGSILFEAPAKSLSLEEIVVQFFSRMQPDGRVISQPPTVMALMANELKGKVISALSARGYVVESNSHYKLTETGKEYFSNSVARLAEMRDRITAVAGSLAPQGTASEDDVDASEPDQEFLTPIEKSILFILYSSKFSRRPWWERFSFKTHQARVEKEVGPLCEFALDDLRTKGLVAWGAPSDTIELSAQGESCALALFGKLPERR
jgi:hypothetical protein